MKAVKNASMVKHALFAATGRERGKIPMSLLRSSCKVLPLVAVFILVSASAPSQEARRAAKVGETDIGEEPLVIFQNIEKAWQSGNAQHLASLASESRVYLEIRGSERRGGYFTKPQVFYIFKDMFASMKQTSFTFVKYHNLEKQDRRIYGMALRRYKSNRSGGLYQDKVYVTLVKEGSRWVMAEIKSTW